MTMMEAPHSNPVGTHTVRTRPVRNQWRRGDREEIAAQPVIESRTGGIIIVGPMGDELAGIDDLLASPNVVGVELVSSRMVSWQTVTNEVIEVSRQVSRVIRTGRTAVVYLDSHVGDAPIIDRESQEFVCARMGQILIGLADAPAFVAVHGERLSKSLVIDCLGDDSPVATDSIDGAFPVLSLEHCRMFPALPVATCPGDRTAATLLRMLDWFESCRVEVDLTVR